MEQEKNSSPSVVALIPARGGSRAIPKKNLADVSGHPLIAYSISTARQSEIIERVFVTTDCEEIAAVAKEYGAEVPFLRPKELAGDNSLDIEFVEHFLSWCEEELDSPPDYIVHLRPTSPNRDPALVDEAVKELRQDPAATALRSVSHFETTGFKLGVVKDGYFQFFGSEHFEEGTEYYNLPRQELPDTYVPNGLVDIIVTKTLRETGTLHGSLIRSFVTHPIADVDTPKDLELARNELKGNVEVVNNAGQDELRIRVFDSEDGVGRGATSSGRIEERKLGEEVQSSALSSIEKV